MNPRYEKNRLYISLFYSRLFLGGKAALQRNIFSRNTLQTSADGNWGLSFGQDGEPPAANATYETLAKYNAYYAEDTKEKRIYLTFDAGFEKRKYRNNHGRLKKHHVPATFFVVGTYIKNNPELIHRMKKEGHTSSVGNHTYHHPDMSQILHERIF